VTLLRKLVHQTPPASQTDLSEHYIVILIFDSTDYHTQLPLPRRFKTCNMPSLSSKSKPAATSGAPPKNASLNSSGRKIIRYRGHQYLRQRLILCLLSGKSVRIDGIREDEVEVGLKGELHTCFCKPQQCRND
jgi:hypothetical protein